MKPYIRSVGVVIRPSLVMKLDDPISNPLTATECDEFVISYSAASLESRLKTNWKHGVTEDQKRRRFADGDKRLLNLHSTFYMRSNYEPIRTSHKSAIR